MIISPYQIRTSQTEEPRTSRPHLGCPDGSLFRQISIRTGYTARRFTPGIMHAIVAIEGENRWRWQGQGLFAFPSRSP